VPNADTPLRSFGAAVDIRVLVVDDSALMRRMIGDMIESAEGCEVIDTARNGREAIEKVQALRPDVVTMDVEMPVMNGIDALREIMAECPTPVVMLSSRTERGAEETIRSLELGAVDFVCKPSGAISMDIAEVKEILIAKLRLAVHARLLPPAVAYPCRRPARVGSPSVAYPCRRLARVGSSAVPADRVVVIGSSTGGPRALETIIPQLPPDLSAAVVVAQHMPPGFTAAMAERLNTLSALRVREAADGDMVTQGEVLIAPGGRHLLVNSRKRMMISDAPPVWGVRPAVDVLMTSAAETYGAACVGVILTGMGQDGARGAALIRRAGGRTLAQDEDTCVVYGMPKAAVEQGGVDLVVPLPQIAATIVQIVRSPAPHAASAEPKRMEKEAR
jgi:two-component system chemotaxis response regulator CheB